MPRNSGAVTERHKYIYVCKIQSTDNLVFEYIRKALESSVFSTQFKKLVTFHQIKGFMQMYF